MNKWNNHLIIYVTSISNLHINCSERNTEWKMQSQIHWVPVGARKYSFLLFFAQGSLNTSAYSICGIPEYSDRQKKVRENVRLKQNSQISFHQYSFVPISSSLQSIKESRGRNTHNLHFHILNCHFFTQRTTAYFGKYHFPRAIITTRVHMSQSFCFTSAYHRLEFTYVTMPFILICNAQSIEC